MKKFFKVICSCFMSLVVCMSLLMISGCGKKSDTIIIVQDLDYSDNAELTYNPDQGFYKAQVFTVTVDGIFYDSNKNAVDFDFSKKENQVYHLRMDISAFSKENNGSEDLELTAKALEDLDSMLNNLKVAQKNAIIRFCYCPDFGNLADKEPSLEMMERHIQQIASVLNKYESSITAIEAGMIGRWGEMNGSKITNDKDVVNAILDTWLSCTDSFPILTRQPQHIYDYLGFETYEQAKNYKIKPSEKAYRLGIFDDSYLGSESDRGTFNYDRDGEIEWISQQTSHLPFGGEASFSDNEKPLYFIEDGCLDNMRKLNLSYLNYHYNEAVTDYWGEQIYSAEMGSDSAYYGLSVYDYIAKHLGYRFVLKNSTFKLEHDMKLEIDLKISNIGFGNLTKTKDLQLIVENSEGDVVLRQNVGKFAGGDVVIKTNLKNLSKGEYKFFVAACSLDGEEITYPIAFSNLGIYNADLKANYIGKMNIT